MEQGGANRQEQDMLFSLLSMKMTRCGEGINATGEIVIRTCIVSGAVYQDESTCGKCVKYLSLNPVGPLYAHLMSGLSNVICLIWGRANRKY